MKYGDLNANLLCCLCFLESSIVGSSAKILHTATFFIICHLYVCNLSPAQSKQCNADIMPGLRWIMCHCYGASVRDASPTLWLESHLASVCLMTFWLSHLIFLPQEHQFSSLLFLCGLYSALCARNVKLIQTICTFQTSDLLTWVKWPLRQIHAQVQFPQNTACLELPTIQTLHLSLTIPTPERSCIKSWHCSTVHVTIISSSEIHVYRQCNILKH